MDYSRLSPKHRVTMWMLCQFIRRKKHRTEEDLAILDTYGTKIDFVNLGSVNDLARSIQFSEKRNK